MKFEKVGQNKKWGKAMVAGRLKFGILNRLDIHPSENLRKIKVNDPLNEAPNGLIKTKEAIELTP